MHINYFADDQRMPVGTEFKHAFELAFEMDRHLLDARRGDFDARDRRETGLGELGIGRREGVSRIHHLSPHRLRHHVDAEFASLAHVLKCMCSEPSGFRAIVSEIIGGMTQTTVKKENGARLVMPGVEPRRQLSAASWPQIRVTESGQCFVHR